MRYSLSSGLMLRDVMELLAKRGTPAVRRVAEQLGKDLKVGWGFRDALERQGATFPPLFAALVSVGEEAGTLPEILSHLEAHYLMQQRLRRHFVSQISWPVIELVTGTLVIAGLIYALDFVSLSYWREAREVPLDPLGLGLIGRRGALIFLGAVFGPLLLATVVIALAKRLLRRKPWFQRFLLSVPALGPCLGSVALARFCIALSLMLETNVSILRTLRLAFLATDNAAFINALPRAEATLRQGNTIATSLERARVLPRKFLSMIAIAEESGRLPEVLRTQAEEFQEEANRRLSFFNQLASWLVWILVALFIAVAIFRIFQVVYLKSLNRLLEP
jgi:type II secretory pathway component PulF